MIKITKDYSIEQIKNKAKGKFQIGNGSFGKVYRLSELKAIKIFFNGRRPSLEKTKRLASMNLPNLVELFEIYSLNSIHDSVLAYEMGLIKGIELDDYFINIDLPTKLMLLQTLKNIILEYHKRKVSIIDLRCPNILVDKNSQITLIDIDNMSYNGEKVEVIYDAWGYLKAGGLLNSNCDIYAYNKLVYYLLNYTKQLNDVSFENNWLKYYEADDNGKLDTMFDHEFVTDYIKIK